MSRKLEKSPRCAEVGTMSACLKCSIVGFSFLLASGLLAGIYHRAFVAPIPADGPTSPPSKHSGAAHALPRRPKLRAKGGGGAKAKAARLAGRESLVRPAAVAPPLPRDDAGLLPEGLGLGDAVQIGGEYSPPGCGLPGVNIGSTATLRTNCTADGVQLTYRAASFTRTPFVSKRTPLSQLEFGEGTFSIVLQRLRFVYKVRLGSALITLRGFDKSLSVSKRTAPLSVLPAPNSRLSHVLLLRGRNASDALGVANSTHLLVNSTRRRTRPARRHGPHAGAKHDLAFIDYPKAV